MTSLRVKRCAYFKCNNTSKDTKLYPFPVKDEARLKIWIENSGNKLLELLSRKALEHQYVCASHFPSGTNEEGKKLTKHGRVNLQLSKEAHGRGKKESKQLPTNGAAETDSDSGNEDSNLEDSQFHTTSAPRKHQTESAKQHPINSQLENNPTTRKGQPNHSLVDSDLTAIPTTSAPAARRFLLVNGQFLFAYSADKLLLTFGGDESSRQPINCGTANNASVKKPGSDVVNSGVLALPSTSASADRPAKEPLNIDLDLEVDEDDVVDTGHVNSPLEPSQLQDQPAKEPLTIDLDLDDDDDDVMDADLDLDDDDDVVDAGLDLDDDDAVMDADLDLDDDDDVMDADLDLDDDDDVVDAGHVTTPPEPSQVKGIMGLHEDEIILLTAKNSGEVDPLMCIEQDGLPAPCHKFVHRFTRRNR